MWNEQDSEERDRMQAAGLWRWRKVIAVLACMALTVSYGLVGFVLLVFAVLWLEAE